MCVCVEVKPGSLELRTCSRKVCTPRAGMTGPKKLGTKRCTPASLAAVVRASCSVMTCARTQEMTTSVPRRRSTISRCGVVARLMLTMRAPRDFEAGYLLLVEGGGTDEGSKFPGR